MERDIIKQLLNEYYSAFNAKDEARILSVFHKNCEFLDFTMDRHMTGLDELSAFICETWERSPHFRVDPETILIDGNQAAVQLTMSGAIKVGKDGTAKPADIWRIPSMSFFRFHEDRMIWKADNWNLLSIPKQVGWLKMLPSMIGLSRQK